MSINDISIEKVDDECIVTYMKIACKISKENDVYYVSSAGEKDYEWFDIVNKYCIKKSPTEKQIIKKIIHYIKKYLEINICKDVAHKSSTDDFNIDYYAVKSKLTKLAEKSSNLLGDEEEHNETNTSSLFDKSTVLNVLMNEFLSCWKWTQSNDVSDELKILLNVGESLFVWNFKLSNFSSKKLENVVVEFELHFHERLYPNYPPIIKMISPQLKNSLMHRISNSKMVQLSYWTPARSVKYIVLRIANILHEWGEVENGEVKSPISKCTIALNTYLTKLSSYIDSVKDDDIIDKNEDFIKFSFLESSKKPTKKETKCIKTPSLNYWKSGTGFGHSGASEWNTDEYLKLQNEKDKNIYNVINLIMTELQKINNSSRDFLNSCNVISESLLLPYLKQQFKQSSLLDIQNKEKLFTLYMQLLELLTSECSIYLFDLKNGDTYSLYDVLRDTSITLKDALKFGDNDFIIYMVSMLDNIIFPIYDEYKKCMVKTSDVSIRKKTEISDEHIDPKSIKEIYKETMTKFRFEYEEIVTTNYHSEYKKLFEEHIDANWKYCQKRLSAELPSLKQEGQLPIDYDASIFIKVDDNNPMVMRALITGPPDTPYDSGCFIIDIYTPPTYPKEAPNFWFLNHGGNRLNPNLYADGKVCLSILGTYVGPEPDQSEMWNKKTSTLLQVLISIQSQILIDNPWFNEPSRETKIGTASGELQNRAYNEKIQLYTMTSTIRDLLENPKMYPQFEDIIKNHFSLKKDYILKLCDKWLKNVSKPYKDKYNVVIADIKKYLNEL